MDIYLFNNNNNKFNYDSYTNNQKNNSKFISPKSNKNNNNYNNLNNNKIINQNENMKKCIDISGVYIPTKFNKDNYSKYKNGALTPELKNKNRNKNKNKEYISFHNNKKNINSYYYSIINK